MNKKIHFIIIDDDSLNNLLYRLIINKTAEGSAINLFLSAEQSLEYIKARSDNKENHSFVIFLDIHMPAMDGWEFLEQFGKIDDGVREQLKLYVLTSSMDPSDKERALQNKHVLDYIEKPLTMEVVSTIISGMDQAN